MADDSPPGHDGLARLLGHALFPTQFMEYSLVGAPFDRLGDDRPRDVVVDRFRQPLGRLVRGLDAAGVERDLAARLRRALGLRNDLVRGSRAATGRHHADGRLSGPASLRRRLRTERP